MSTVAERDPMMLYAIAPTQFTGDGRSVDAAAMAANVERLAATGIRHVLLTGAYGEFHSLSDADHGVCCFAVSRGDGAPCTDHARRGGRFRDGGTAARL